jgi:SAM-dependent methyltransferase
MSFAQSIFRKGADYVDLQWGHTIATLKTVAPLAHGRLLDVGCGTKPYEDIFKPFVTEYIGVEYTEAFETTHASQNSSKVDVFYSGDRLPFDDASFDTALSVQVLEHTPTPGALSAEIGRILRDHGTALIMAPFSFRLHEEPNDFFRYTPHGLTTLLNAAELDVTKIIPMGGLWSVIGHKLNSYLGLHVANAAGIAQTVGKCSHENSTVKPFSLGSLKLPLVAPAMFVTAWSARRLDSLLPDPTESLGFLAVAKRRAR